MIFVWHHNFFYILVFKKTLNCSDFRFLNIPYLYSIRRLEGRKYLDKILLEVEFLHERRNNSKSCMFQLFSLLKHMYTFLIPIIATPFCAWLTHFMLCIRPLAFDVFP